ncbi:MAG: cytochrome b N-terminal domain-containing protein [Planctomycetota bacterium]|jgi:quinol-cytochrome oxidoreductase complex cytochrome b subunit
MSEPTETAKQLRRIRTTLFGARSRLGGWLTEAADQRVSPHYRGLRWLSAAAILLLLIELATGILLSLYYAPAPDAAYASARFINERVPAGWLVRSVHSWAGELLLLVVAAHIVSAFVRRAYAHPRQYLWLVGALILPALVALRFTGRLLPWDAHGREVSQGGLEILEQVPVFGGLTATWLRGAEEMGPNTLARFFTTHTLVLPWVVAVLLAMLLFLTRRYGMRRPEEDA